MADGVQGSIIRTYGVHLGIPPEDLVLSPVISVAYRALDGTVPPAPPSGLTLARAVAPWPLLAAAFTPHPDRRTAMRILLALAVTLALAAPPAAAIDFTVSASVVTATYAEPTLNADGSALGDLDHTSVYYRIGTQEPVKGPAVPASAAAGGGAITTQVNVPVAAGQEADVDFWATATDASGNESAPSATVTVRIDRLPPAPPQ